jgi:hypothetical protein
MIIQGKDMVVAGRLPRVARLAEEWDVDLTDPAGAAAELAAERSADLLTFIQRLPESRPRHPYYREWESVAAIPISSYDSWWNQQTSQEARNKVRKAAKKGIEVREVRFDDEFLKGVMEIYNENPLRQGKPFKYFGYDPEEIRRGHTTFPERCDYIGAYLGDELAGFVKLVYTDRFARTMYVISKMKHRNRGPMNALVAKAVEVCAERGAPYLVYGRYSYGTVGSDTLRDFKQGNGFENMIIPRYWVPLTPVGRAILKLKLHKGIVPLLPAGLTRRLIQVRAAHYKRKYGRLTGGDPGPAASSA